jgi:uncharacterized protein HemX
MKTKITIAIAMMLFLGLSTSSFAQTRHPRRAEVNHRLARQNERIDKKEADGDMSKKEGRKLHHEDHQIRHEEKDMASQDGGHITKQEQKTLNQQENHDSRQIKNN